MLGFGGDKDGNPTPGGAPLGPQNPATSSAPDEGVKTPENGSQTASGDHVDLFGAKRPSLPTSLPPFMGGSSAVASSEQPAPPAPNTPNAPAASRGNTVVDVNSILTGHGTALTSDDVINKDYNTTYKLFEQPVVNAIEWLRDILSERNLNSDVAAAKRDRGGPKYRELHSTISSLLLNYFTKEARTTTGNTPILISMVTNEVLGLGPLEPLWQDKRITEIMVNGPHKTRIEIDGKLITAKGVKFRDTEHLLEVCSQILAPLNKSIDVSHPLQDGRLPDGSRINVTHPAVGPGGPYLTIRRFPETIITLRKYIGFGSMTPEIVTLLGNLVHHGCSTLIAGGTGSGKAVSLDTLLPTPTGFTTMGDVQVGDIVLDENAEHTLVTAKFPQEGRDSFEITFDDGTVVIADAEHNWWVAPSSEVLGHGSISEKVLTTQELVETSVTEAGSPAFAVRAVSRAIPYAERRLPHQPYKVGKALAGASVEALREIGFDGDWEALCIPEVYMTASIAQREELVAGFLDKGGKVDTDGTIYFLTGDDTIAKGFRRLLSSLGFIASLKVRGSNWSVEFSTERDLFKENLKLQEVHRARRQAHDLRDGCDWRFITSITAVESVPMACITVDSPKSLYLVSDAFVPTHNTSMLNALSGVIPEHERVVTIEDSLELRLHPAKDVIAMEARTSQREESNVTIRTLVRNALRQRPDRIVVGEVRDGAAYDMLQAMNTGHEGSMTTVHANDAEGAIDRMVNLISQVGELNSNQSLSLISNGLDLIVTIGRFEDGSRRLVSIAEVPSRVSVEQGKVSLTPVTLWEFEQTGVDEKGMIVGEYVERNPISDELRRKHRLDKRVNLNLDQILELSDYDPSQPVAQ